MSFDGPELLVSFLISGIGFVLFRYGRKMERMPHVVSGVVLMVFPYFVSNLWLQGGISAAVLGVLWLLVNQGW